MAPMIRKRRSPPHVRRAPASRNPSPIRPRPLASLYTWRVKPPRPWHRAAPLVIPLLLLVGLWLPGVTQGGYRVDTGLYAAIGLHAWREGTLFPLMAGESLYMNKPPLAIWIHGLFLHFFGPELWVARLPSLLAAAGAAVVGAAAVRRLCGWREACLFSIVLCTTLEFFRYTKAISLDLWLTLFFMLSLWCIARALPSSCRGGRSPARGEGWWIVASGVPIGLALLTKPLMALLAIPIFAGWLIWIRRPRLALRLLPSAALALFIGATWHLAMWRAIGDEFLSHYFGTQTLERATGESFASQPWWYYLALAAETYWPWLAALLAGAPTLLRGAFARSGSGAASSSTTRASRFILLWTLVWLVALSAFAGKSGRYAVVLWPMLAWAAALWLASTRVKPLVLARRALMRWAAPVVLLVGMIAWALPIRIHTKPDAHWDALYAFVRERPGETFFVAPSLLTLACNVYLSTGVWPASIDGPAAPPPPGSLIIYRSDRQAQPSPQDEPVWTEGKMIVVRRRAP